MSLSTDIVALTLLPIWRWRLVMAQVRAGQHAAKILEQHCHECSRASVRVDPDVLRSKAFAAIGRARQRGLDAIEWHESSYPAALAQIIDPPPVLWLRGARSAFEKPAVAIVGSRAASPYALTVAERLASDVAQRGIVIISGLARGVDSAAHRGALSVGGQTLAVLGCGADVVYPHEHASLAADIAVRGAVLSELVPGTPPRSPFFPQRNRIISGLARAVVVVEAGEKSGSLITARCALDQGRDVLAVPGNVLNGRNKGGHALLRDGAKLVETADDILEELGLPSADAREPGPREPASNLRDAAGSPPVGDAVLACLVPGESCDLDAISARSGMSPAPLLARLFELELQGFVRRAGGGQFVRSR